MDYEQLVLLNKQHIAIMELPSVNRFAAAAPPGDIGRDDLDTLWCFAGRSFTRVALGAVEGIIGPASGAKRVGGGVMPTKVCSTLGRSNLHNDMMSIALGISGSVFGKCPHVTKHMVEIMLPVDVDAAMLALSEVFRDR